MLKLVYSFLLVHSVLGCMKTAEPATTLSPPTAQTPGATTAKPGVTTVPPKTTKGATKTTTKAPGCTSECALADVELLGYPVSADPTDPTPLTPVPKLDCNTLTVTCTGPAGTLALMDFNDKHDQLYPPGTNVATATLTCKAGAWTTRAPDGTDYFPMKIWCGGVKL